MSWSHLKVMMMILITATGCTSLCSRDRKDLSPEEVVQSYLDISLNMKEIDQKAKLINLTTGNLREAIEQASDDLFTEAFIKQNYHLESYSVVERRDRTPRETEITFLVVYRDLGPERKLKPDEAAQISTENTVSVVKYKGAWAIQDVLGKSTTIDFPLIQASEIRPSGAGPKPPEAE